jgi:hypothetical protein
MAQLIKMHHFPSRYETNIYQYSSRFTQRKQRKYQNFVEKSGLYENEEELKSRFFDHFFKGQLTWATTTSTMESPDRVNSKNDLFLKQLLRMFDDTTLVLYHPTLHVADAEIDCDIILLTPLAVWCIQVVMGEKESVFQGINAHEWKEITSDGSRVLTNPYIGLSKSMKAVQHIFEEQNMEADVKGIIFVPDSYVEFAQYGATFDVIDRTKRKDWISKINHHRSTLKHGQLRAAELLLKQAKTTAIFRA